MSDTDKNGAFHWLYRPYPQIEGNKIKVAVAFFLGLVCFIFLLIFQPFGITEISGNKEFYILLFGLNCTHALLIAYFILPKILTRYFKPTEWKVINEIVFFIIVLILIAIFNYILNVQFLYGKSPQHGFFSFLWFACTVGILPIFIMTHISERVARNRNMLTAAEFNKEVTHVLDIDSNDIVSFQSPVVKSDKITLKVDDFIYAEAEKNYTNFYFFKDDKIDHSLLRISLKTVITQAEDINQIVRCHKSFVINRNKIEAINGNARSLFLKLYGLEKEIPVSRSLNKKMLRSSSHSSQV